MQLVAYGAQDIYLTGNPMITYFKVVYRRHTNFAMESIQQTFSGTVNFGSRVTALISRNGDLVSGMTLEATLPATTTNPARWTDDVGHHLIQQVEVEIGGQLIDRHYSDWLEIWAQLTVPASKKTGYRQMIGQDKADQLGQPLGLQALTNPQPTRKLYIPLQFWFCRNVGLALPLIALQYHEVKVNITFAAAASLVAFGATTGSLTADLWVDYIYLDTDERRRFAQVSHEYLIEQLQFNGDESVANTSVPITLNFNHPVKELVWVARLAANTAADQWSNFTTATPVILPTEATIAEIDGRYENGANNAANTRRANYYEAQGQWFTKPRNMRPTGTLATGGVTQQQVAVVAGNNLTLTNHNLVVGDRLIVTSATGNGVTLNAIYSVFAVVDNANVTISTDGTVAGRVAFVAPGNIVIGRYNPIIPALGVNPVVNAKLQLNGQDRFTVRDSGYFNLVQPNTHHTSIPDSPGINVYSFALKPEEHQPSGTCNFSRIDNAKLQLTMASAAASVVKVFATNYNVLRVMSGMGGLAYSN